MRDKKDVGGQGAVDEGQSMFSVKTLAQRWDCSKKHVRRLHDAGKIPKAIRLGSLLRWPYATIEKWEKESYPNWRKRKS